MPVVDCQNTQRIGVVEQYFLHVKIIDGMAVQHLLQVFVMVYKLRNTCWYITLVSHQDSEFMRVVMDQDLNSLAQLRECIDFRDTKKLENFNEQFHVTSKFEFPDRALTLR